MLLCRFQTLKHVMNNTVFISTVGAKKKGLLPGGTGNILLPLIVLVKKDTLATSLAENHFLLISRHSQASSILSLPTERNLLSAMELETDHVVTSEVGMGTMISGAVISHHLTSRAEMSLRWISEVGSHLLLSTGAGICTLETSGREKGPLWTSGGGMFPQGTTGTGTRSE